MKSYKVHRNIRKKALLFGLPISFFALQMVAVIGSLLVLIFSFGLLSIVIAFGTNISLYAGLLKLTRKPNFFQFQKVYPKAIQNKLTTQLHYENH